MQYKTLLTGKHEAMHYSSQIQHFITVQPKHLLQFGNIPTLQKQTLLTLGIQQHLLRGMTSVPQYCSLKWAYYYGQR